MSERLTTERLREIERYAKHLDGWPRDAVADLLTEVLALREASSALIAKLDADAPRILRVLLEARLAEMTEADFRKASAAFAAALVVTPSAEKYRAFFLSLLAPEVPE